MKEALETVCVELISHLAGERAAVLGAGIEDRDACYQETGQGQRGMRWFKYERQDFKDMMQNSSN